MTKDKDIKTVVPALRFPEFRDAEGWNKTTLKSISERLTKKVGNLKLPPVSISASIGFVTQTEKFGRDISGEQYKNYIVLNYGDFAYNKGNSKKYPQGCICKLTEFTCVAAPNAFLCFRFNANVVADFYKGYFDNNYHGKQLQQHITSGARSDGLLNINPNDFFGIILPTPRLLKEQQMIADCLGSLDDLINAVADKIEALKEHKKGLMQQLFPADGKTTPALRFPEFQNAGEWRETTLGQEVHYENGKAHENDIDEAGQYIVVNSKFISTDGEVVKYTDNPFCLAEKGDILMVLSDVPNGRAIAKCFIVGSDGKYTVNQRICKLKPKKAVGLLLYYIINRNPFLLAFDDGIKQTNLKKDDVLNCPFRVPKDPKEQQRIADCLLAVDELTSAEADKLDQLKAHKKGLMQQLFPTINE